MQGLPPLQFVVNSRDICLWYSPSALQYRRAVWSHVDGHSGVAGWPIYSVVAASLQLCFDFNLSHSATIRQFFYYSHGGGRGGGEGVRRRQRDNDYNDYDGHSDGDGKGDGQERRRGYTRRQGTQTQDRFNGRGWGGGDNHEHDADSQEDNFCIMAEIGNDKVVAALQVIIDQFGDHIKPHAVALVTQLSTAFQKYCRTGGDDNDASMAAAKCLECIDMVLKVICERPELFEAMEPQLVPLCLQILGNDGYYIEYL